MRDALCRDLARRSLVCAWLLVLIACRSSGDGRDQAAPSASGAAAAQPPAHLRLTAPPPSGPVAAIVRDALAAAQAENRALVVYVGASWCEPCQRFHDAARRGELDSAFGRLTLLEFDQDRDGERLAASGYASQYIPLFALPRADGFASGKQVEGAVKGDGAVAYLVPRLQALLAQ